MQITHVGLLAIFNNKITKVKYLESKFSRELGDTLTIDGKPYRVGVIGDSKASVCLTLNDLVKKQNKIVRRENKIANAKVKQKINATFGNIVEKALKNCI
jgi:D-alanine-D-alanine ligase-like ATP-grasp enzyme